MLVKLKNPYTLSLKLRSPEAQTFTNRKLLKLKANKDQNLRISVLLKLKSDEKFSKIQNVRAVI